MTPRCTHSPSGDAARQAAAVAARVPVLETARLRLRAATLDDLPAWTRVLGDDPNRHMGGPLDAEGAFEAFCVYVAGWMLHGHGLWAVTLKEGGETIGFVQIGLEWEDPEPELGWSLLPEHRGHGYATEAAEAARAHALGLYGAGGVVSFVAEGNDASHRVAERLGAWRDGTLDGCVVWRHGRAA